MVTKYLNKLQGKRVLIVGGSTGIGYGIAEASVEHGAHVVISSRSQAKIDAAIASLTQTYPEHAANISGFAATLSDRPEAEKEIKALFDFATANGKEQLNHVVETAGDLEHWNQANMESVTPDIMSKLMAVRLVGVIMLAKVAGNYLAKEASSSFTMTSGVLMFKPRKGLGPLVAIGAGKEGLNRALAVDFAPIRINLVSPGAIETELMWSFAPDGDREKLRKDTSERTLVGRMATPSDLAEVYLGLMKNNYQTGTIVHFEGGYLLL